MLANVSVPASHRQVRTAIPGPISSALQQRRSRAVSAAVTSTLPVYITSADGGLLHDVDGNTYIDFGSGIAVTNVGHAAPAVVDRVKDQVERFTHTCFMIAPYEGYVEVCEALADLTPGDQEKRSALFNSGAEAVENAVKVARAATGRQAVVVFDHAYHGRTNLTMALTSKSVPYKHGFGPFAPEIYRVSGSYPFRDGLTGPESAAQALDRIDKQIGADQVAAVVIEPVQGEGGFIEPAPGFLPALSQWCTRNGVVFIADEVQTGFGRTGDWFACEYEGVVPDVIVTAKGIAAGLPLAAVTGRADLLDAVPPGGLGGTYGGNPVACAAALGSIETIRDQKLVVAARRIGTIALPRLRALPTDTIGHVRGRGAMLAVEFVKPGTREPDAELVRRIAKTCHDAGVVVLTCGTYGNVIRLLPPLSLPAELLDEGLTVLADAIRTAV
ncbi:4-aminobutyrate--2-oxoglutarate transaminase [Nocardia sp. NBC_00565]|uniref:4-aminobutyrate--2-oxoglutarate transaminase n=1 Tax=Nocardia sp. NBC_00565 TaxID=2975993 RepID=UPI002E816986|nr:4-aminobutyrate--2-oxoglutarate transaminase [Nocardia sp. NBC_00565]WUC07553.1 4-aminobutyrate--2-oxoglutarate transaminase [Nocardia sp. NBC_00565]